MTLLPPDHEWDSDEWSETEGVEEVHITRFLNKGLLQGIQQAKACTEVKGGIKRHPGHYHLRDRAHAVLRPKAVAYDGKHWHVPATNKLQRATRRLSAYAIQRVVAQEQLRRTKNEKVDKETMTRLFRPVHVEFWDRIEKGKEEEWDHLAKKRNEIAALKDAALAELMRRHNRELINADIEEERERQVAMVSILNGMKDSVHKSSSLENIMLGIAETNHRKNIVQQDLSEAFARFADEEQEVDLEYRGAMMEMMDESLNALQQRFQRNKTKFMEMEEQNRRIYAIEDLVNDRNYRRGRREFGQVMLDLKSMFNVVQSKQTTDLYKLEQEMSDRKELVLQELRRNYAWRWVDRVAAIEKKRRIKEGEQALFLDDPNRETMLRLVARVQRQMILQKFAGTWINLSGVNKKDREVTDFYDFENDHDQKLRAMRLKARRQSCVMSGLDSS